MENESSSFELTLKVRAMTPTYVKAFESWMQAVIDAEGCFELAELKATANDEETGWPEQDYSSAPRAA